MKNIIAFAAGIAVMLVLAPQPSAQQAERIALGTPVAAGPTPPTIANYEPDSFCVYPVNHVRVHPSIVVAILSNVEERPVTFTYPSADVPAFDTDAEVTGLINGLNGANLSAVVGGLQQTLWRRTFARLVADFPSSFSGGGTVQ